MNPSLEAALALVDIGPAHTLQWMEKSGPMCEHCQHGENVDQAASRILAAEVRRITPLAEDLEVKLAAQKSLNATLHAEVLVEKETVAYDIERRRLQKLVLESVRDTQEKQFADMETENATLRARIAVLECHLEKTADGKLVIESEKLYCPKCRQEVRCEYDLAYCDHCPNPDSDALPPLPLLFGLCLASP